MTPFLLPRESRFSSGLFGVLYASEEIGTALRESGHHQALRLKATSAPAGTTVPMYSISPAINTIVVDARQPGVDAAIYDPNSYTASRALGRQLRADGHEGLVYGSVRNPGGTCVALFWPDAVNDVRDGYEWRFYFDGVKISEFSKVS
jgi:RES domain-containing protein